MKESIEEALKGVFKGGDELSQAISYALLSGGKRLRPQIVLRVADALGFGFPVMDAALAIEFFHTASLIADDLPCMDNDAERRGKASVHTVFGETCALLSSYALISEAYKKIEENGRKMALVSPHALEATVICLEQASRSSGIRGAVLGQYYDLFGSQEESLETIFYLKTGTLFEGAFVLGWVFGGGALASVPEVKELARHFGFAFQILDDIDDYEQDGKDHLNFAVAYGVDGARERLHREVEAAESYLTKLSLEKLTPLLFRVFQLT